MKFLINFLFQKKEKKLDQQASVVIQFATKEKISWFGKKGENFTLIS
jgi:hypothetical protein